MRYISTAKKTLLATCLVIFAFATVTALGARSGSKAAAAMTACSSGFTLGVSGTAVPGGPTGSVGNIAYILIGSPATSAPNIQSVIVKANNTPIGRAQSTSSYSWSMPWVTGLQQNGSYMMAADVYFTGTTAPCEVSSQPVQIFNATAARINTVAQPVNWRGPMSYSFPITLNTNTSVPEFDATPYAIYSWGTTIGSVNPANHKAQFTSGQTTGNGSVNVAVRYGGNVSTVVVPIIVEATTAPLPNSSTPTTTNNGSTESDPETPASTQTETPTVTSGETALQNNPVAQDCIVGMLGDARFADINTGVIRPSTEEIGKYKVCFASSNYILPSNFAPVAPDGVKKLNESSKTAVRTVKNVTTETKEGKKLGLKLSGKAQSNGTVLIYIFSDPLVLTTTADADGNWEYTLENPIEPGKHEIYTVVDRGDGTYERSRPLSFLIGTATAAEANPAGLSLQLTAELTPDESNRSLLLYIGAIVVVVLLVLLALLVTVRKRRAKVSEPIVQPVMNDTEGTISQDGPQDGPLNQGL